MRRMRHQLCVVGVFLTIGLCRIGAQDLYFPPTTGQTWETVAPASLGWRLAAIDSLLDYLESNNTRAFIVLKDGRIAIERYFGSFARDSAWYWASAGKTLTAVLVGIAQEGGLLTLADTTSRWLGRGWTSCPPEKEDGITIRHQLTMTTGLDDDVADPYCTEPHCLRYRADAGTRWAYHNGPYTLLDTVIRIATGTTLNQFFFTRVAAPTGMTGIFLKSGYNTVFFSTARSMARFGLLILNRGRWDTTAVLRDSTYFHHMTHTSQSINQAYGYLWWLNGTSSYMIPQTQFVFPGSMTPSAPPDMIAALGKNGQFVNVVPSLGLVFVRMGDSPDNLLVPFLLNEEIWQRLNAVLSISTSVPQPDRPRSLPQSLRLEQNYPNPFNPVTMLRYSLGDGTGVQESHAIFELGSGSEESGAENPGVGKILVRLAVYDLLGREVAVLVDEWQAPGRHAVTFNASAHASGVYTVVLTAGGSVAARPIVLVR